MTDVLSKIGCWILDLLFPRKCIFCQRILPLNEQNVCMSCAMELPVYHGEDKPIAGANRCVSVLRYEAAVKESIQRYKFDAREFYCLYYGELLAASFSAKYDGHVDLVSWVPISKQRLAKRGFNQSQRLVLEMVKHCKVPAVNTLVKTVNNPAQSRMHSAEQRRKNVSGVYRAVNVEAWSGKNILLVDDVVTTGSTLSECCRVLKSAGAASVSCLALAATSLTRS